MLDSTDSCARCAQCRFLPNAMLAMGGLVVPLRQSGFNQEFLLGRIRRRPWLLYQLPGSHTDDCAVLSPGGELRRIFGGVGSLPQCVRQGAAMHPAGLLRTCAMSMTLLCLEAACCFCLCAWWLTLTRSSTLRSVESNGSAGSDGQGRDA